MMASHQWWKSKKMNVVENFHEEVILSTQVYLYLYWTLRVISQEREVEGVEHPAFLVGLSRCWDEFLFHLSAIASSLSLPLRSFAFHSIRSWDRIPEVSFISTSYVKARFIHPQLWQNLKIIIIGEPYLQGGGVVLARTLFTTEAREELQSIHRLSRKDNVINLCGGNFLVPRLNQKICWWPSNF